LRELCLRLEEIAAEDALDYDGATSAMREWVSEPIDLDRRIRSAPTPCSC